MQRPSLLVAVALGALVSAGVALAAGPQALPRPKPQAVEAAAEVSGAPIVAKGLKNALEAALKGDEKRASEITAQLRDPVAKTLVEWALIRAGTIDRDHARIAEFANENPAWPGSALTARRTEQALLKSGARPEAVFAHFGRTAPAYVEGRIAVADAYRKSGDETRATAYARAVWHTDDLSEAREKAFLLRHGPRIRPQDHRLRMLQLLFDGEYRSALRSAERLGTADLAVAKAFMSAVKGGKDAQKLLDAIPEASRGHAGYKYALVTHLRREDKTKEAAEAVLKDGRKAGSLVGGDGWYLERAILARRLIDAKDYETAYRLMAEHTSESASERADAEFLAGWVALRFLDRADLAEAHFGRMARGVSMPISIGRAHYWLGRAHEAAGHGEAAKASYTASARHATTFYGQLSMTKLGHKTLALPTQPTPDEAQKATFDGNALVHAVRLLSGAERQDLIVPFLAALADHLHEPAQMALLADLAEELGGARYMLIVGKMGLYRGLPVEAGAFPTSGIPAFSPVGPEVDTAVVYSIARQESAFHATAKSHAGARGLLQLMPATAKMTAKSYGLPYNLNRLTSDPAYNAQLGAAHLGDLIERYSGSLILTFAAYNAGPGNVRDWLGAYGDPRTDEIEPLDWLELIPFSETRNYVQRIMENVQVYRARLAGAEAPLTIEDDLRRGRAGS